MNKKKKIKKFEWLFIFIIYSDYSHDDSTDVMKQVTKGLFETFKYTRINNRSKIAIIHNPICRNKDLTKCSHVVRCKRGKNYIKVIEYLTRSECYLMQKKKGLGESVKELNKRFPACKHCIITCDHGSILGINKLNIDSPVVNPNDSVDRYYGSYDDQPIIAERLGVSIEELLNTKRTPASFEILTSDELAEVITIGLEKKAEVVIMYNCCMQTLMTQYALRNATQYLVAPGTLIAYPGYNFKYILNKSFRKNVSCEDILRLISGSFTNHNRNYKGKYSEIIDTWGIWGIQLGYIDCNFIDQLNRVADFFSENLDNLIGNKPFWCRLVTMMTNEYAFDNPNSTAVFDLKRMIMGVKNALIAYNISTAILDDMLALLKAQPRHHNFRGKSLTKAFAATPDGPSGYLILLPKAYRSFDDIVLKYYLAKENRQKISFFDSEKVHWVHFLDEYRGKLPVIPSDSDPCSAKRFHI